jgi:hypothetical protein
MRLSCENRFDFADVALVIVLALLSLAGCRPAASPDAQSDRPARGAPAATPLPTRETTIDPVTKKLDAAQQDLERRRAEADQVGK